MNITVFKNVSSGYAKLQTFNFLISSNPIIVHEHVTWILDNGLVVENKPDVFVKYDKAGTYNPTVLVYTTTEVLSATFKIKVEDYVEETIYMSNVPPPTYAGFLNLHPFRVNVTSSQTNSHRIDLYAKDSRSDNYQNPQNKWSFSKPQWRFLDLSGNQIDFVETINTEIIVVDSSKDIDGNPISRESITVGTSGYADFYFVDDIYNEDLVVSSQPHTTIIATMDVMNLSIDNIPTHANSKVKSETPHAFLYKKPDYLKITENGINEFSKNKWSFTKNRFVISPAYNDETGLVSTFCHFLILDSNAIDINLNVVGVSAFNTGNTPEFKWIDSSGYKIGGFYSDYFTVNQLSAEKCRLIADFTFSIPSLSIVEILLV